MDEGLKFDALAEARAQLQRQLVAVELALKLGGRTEYAPAGRAPQTRSVRAATRRRLQRRRHPRILPAASPSARVKWTALVVVVGARPRGRFLRGRAQ